MELFQRYFKHLMFYLRITDVDVQAIDAIINFVN